MSAYLRQVAADLFAGSLPRWQRWLCAVILLVSAPIWMGGLLIVAGTLAVQNLVTQLMGGADR